MTKTPKVGFAGSFRAPLGPYQVQVMHAIDALGDAAYGGRIEAYLVEQGFKSNRGEVYGATTRMAERGFLSEETVPHPTRGGAYKVTVYAITKTGRAALTVSKRMYDGTHFVPQKS
jgi:DNA-binding PadR family transcriptional regulator